MHVYTQLQISISTYLYIVTNFIVSDPYKIQSDALIASWPHAHIVPPRGYDAIAYYDTDIEFQGDITPVLRCAASGKFLSTNGGAPWMVLHGAFELRRISLVFLRRHRSTQKILTICLSVCLSIFLICLCICLFVYLFVLPVPLI